MTPRTILYTGKGGVGKTSVAAATALAIARSGLRTIVMSTDPAHSLSDSLETGLGPQPMPVADNLWAQEVQAEAEMERHWQAVQRWLGGAPVRPWRGPDPGRGADGATRDGRDLLAAPAEAPSRVRRVRRDHRGLRTHGRDAAAAVVPGGRTMVAREGLPVGEAPVDRGAAVRKDGARPAAARQRRAGRGPGPGAAT